MYANNLFVDYSTIQGPPPPSFPGCSAAMKCVTEEFCSVDGVMVNTPVRLSPFEKEYLRVPLMVMWFFKRFLSCLSSENMANWSFSMSFPQPCLNTESNQEGFCCRDPLYNDPWPAGMPMP